MFGLKFLMDVKMLCGWIQLVATTRHTIAMENKAENLPGNTAHRPLDSKTLEQFPCYIMHEPFIY